MEPISIQMLGDFSLSAGEVTISDSDNRARKNWLLMAYLIYNRGRVVSQKKVVELLWGDDPTNANPESALRTTFHRVRTLLNRLWPDAGHQLIQRKENGYFWNEAIPVITDYERFDVLCTSRPEEDTRRLEDRMAAIALYRGDFLEKQSSENWVVPIGTYFHNRYIEAVMEAVELLTREGRHREAAALCREAVHSEPYHELLHQKLMQSLAACGNQDDAVKVYEAFSKRLFDDFGIRPNPEIRNVYREIAHAVSEQTIPMDLIMEHLQEEEPASGAMRCDYDYFKVLCHAQSRAIARSGNAAHVVLLSISGSELSKRSTKRVMEQLGEQIRTNLRRGDVFSQCSVSQYIVLLPGANYENSCMVSRRILAAFSRRHPHVTAAIHFMVQPLSPGISIP